MATYDLREVMNASSAEFGSETSEPERGKRLDQLGRISAQLGHPTA